MLKVEFQIGGSAAGKVKEDAEVREGRTRGERWKEWRELKD